MKLLNKQKAFLSSWYVAKLLWLAQALSSLCFGIPLIIMILFAANIALPVIQRTILLYLGISFFVYVPFNGILSLILLKSIKKILNKIYKKDEGATKEGSRVVGEFLNLPLRFSLITFSASSLGFVFGLFLLWLGLIPELMILIEVIIVIGLAVGFATCVVQIFLVYIFLENYFRSQIEFLSLFYLEAIGAIKARRFPLFWKIFFLVFLSVAVAQTSLWALYLGRVIIYSPEDIVSALTYVGIVAILTLIHVVIVTVFFSRNLVYPIRELILWAGKIIKGETKEEISLVTNDEIAELVEYLKRMHEELEDAKASLEIKIKARTRELEELTERQEEIIKERIKEIQKRAEELEKFKKLAVGRELKMIEMKKEIKKLEERFK